MAAESPSDDELLDTAAAGPRLGRGPADSPRLAGSLRHAQGPCWPPRPASCATCMASDQHSAAASPRALREIDAEAEVARCRQHGIAILTESHAGYPRVLREIHDPPGVLFVRGQIKPQDGLAIAIVGTRHATQYGLQTGAALGRQPRPGRTNDHQWASPRDRRGGSSRRPGSRGRTLAVLGSGVLNVYPPEHKRLAEEVIAQGALISESPPPAEPLAGTFPQRNRIISGMSLGVIVVEAGHQKRRTDHGTAGHGARTRSVCTARPRG